MAFFPRLHDPAVSNLIDAATHNPAFESYFRAHIAKLLLIRGGSRYASKGNYNIARLAYLARLFPDARFVVPVRHPVAHVASLMRQQRNFLAGLDGNPKGLAHLARVGHFEFGPDRRPINLGDRAATESVLALWREGDEVRGWARYWSHVYGHAGDVCRRLADDGRAPLIVRYEDLCREPRAMLERLFDHVGLAPPDGMLADGAQTISEPDYYEAGLSPAERSVIAAEAGATAARFGYAV